MKILVTAFLIATTIVTSTDSPAPRCGPMDRKHISELLNGYLYDNSLHTETKTGDRGRYMEYNFTLFRKPNYLFAFEVSGEAKKVSIQLFKEERGSRVKVFDSDKNDFDESNRYLIKVDDPSRKYIVRYTIPPGVRQGCINMALGYKYERETTTSSKKKNRVRIVD